jgi:hypothetical protein
MHSRRIRDVANDFTRRAVDHHHMCGARNKHMPRRRFNGDVVRVSIAFDVELLNLKCLGVPNMRGILTEDDRR